jgi:hypothetical protein
MLRHNLQEKFANPINPSQLSRLLIFSNTSRDTSHMLIPASSEALSTSSCSPLFIKSLQKNTVSILISHLIARPNSRYPSIKNIL